MSAPTQLERVLARVDGARTASRGVDEAFACRWDCLASTQREAVAMVGCCPNPYVVAHCVWGEVGPLDRRRIKDAVGKMVAIVASLR